MAVEFEDIHDIKELLKHKPEKISALQQALIKMGVVDTGQRANTVLFFVALLFFALSIIIFIIGLTIAS